MLLLPCLLNFTPVSADDLGTVIQSLNCSTSSLDPIPSPFVKAVLTAWLLLKTGFYHLGSTAKVRSSLSQENAEKRIHAFISTWQEHRNTLLTGISKKHSIDCSDSRMQLPQFYLEKREYDHKTHVLKPLHWLPVNFRNGWKISMLIFKVWCSSISLLVTINQLDFSVHLEQAVWLFPRSPWKLVKLPLAVMPRGAGTFHPIMLCAPTLSSFKN